MALDLESSLKDSLGSPEICRNLCGKRLTSGSLKS